MTDKMKTGEPSWRWRRIMAFFLVGFCCFMIAGLGLMPEIADTRVNETIVSSAFWLAGTIFLLYGGFATAQDVSAIVTTRTARPYSDPPQQPTPPPPVADTVIVQQPVAMKPEPDAPSGGD